MGDEAAADTEPADPALQPPPAESSDAKPADKHAKKAAKRLRNALGCATDAAIIDSFAEATMMDLSSGVINIEVGGMFIAALKVAGPKSREALSARQCFAWSGLLCRLHWRGRGASRFDQAEYARHWPKGRRCGGYCGGAQTPGMARAARSQFILLRDWRRRRVQPRRLDQGGLPDLARAEPGWQ